MKFLQVHQFYDHYLSDLYQKRNPHLKSASFEDQSLALIKDSFSGVHIMAPYVTSVGWEGTLVVANNPYSQVRWWQEFQDASPPPDLSFEQILDAQINHYKPDILYLTEPIRFSSEFVRALSYRPALVLGWRAANIPDGTDWSEFDIILSSLRGVRETALTLGAKSAAHFWPAMPEWLAEELLPLEATEDLMFCGQWTLDQHPRRNALLDALARLSADTRSFSCAYYLSGQLETLSDSVAACNRGSRFGLGMMHALRSARIAFDARGNIGIPGASVGKSGHIDLAKKETANMRIFEATGAGRLLITEHFDNLSEIFRPDDEIITFNEWDDLREKVLHYTSHPEEAATIAQRGYERCLRDHCMEVRVQQLADIVRHYQASHSRKSEAVAAPSKEPPPAHSCPLEAGHCEDAAVTPEVSEAEQGTLIDEALDQILTHHYASALQLLGSLPSKQAVRDQHYAEALCHIGTGNIEEAKDALQKEVEAFPDHEEAQSFLRLLQSGL